MNNILLIEDDLIFAKKVQHFFMKFKEVYRFSHFSCIEDALPFIETSQPNYLLLDDQLMGENGTDALPILKRLTPCTHFILISANSAIALADKAFKRGSDDFLSKDTNFFKKVAAIINPG